LPCDAVYLSGGRCLALSDACWYLCVGKVESDSAVNVFGNVGYRLAHVFLAILVRIEELGRRKAAVCKRVVARGARVGVSCKICL